ncbi:MAG: tetratricopeptide repeat protein [bacterium]
MGYHLFNIMLNALFSVFLYWIGLRVFKDRWKALAAALLFTVHPIHSEPAVFVSAIGDVLAGVLMAGGLLCFWENGGRESVGRYLCGTGLFVLALLSKEVSVVFPVLVLATDVIVRRIPLRWDLIFRRLPLFILSFAYLSIRFFVFGKFAQAKLIYGWDMSVVVPSAIKLIPHYLGQLVYPYNLCPDDNFFKIALSFWEPVVWGTVLGCLAAGVIILISWRGARALAFGAAWFAITLLPAMQIVPLGTFCADRYLYLPSAGFCIVVVCIFSATARLMSRGEGGRRFLLMLLAFAFAVFWGVRAPVQNLVWRNDVVLYRTMTRCAPHSYRAHNDLGKALVKRNRLAEAAEEFEMASEINPADDNMVRNLGRVYGRMGRYEDAERAFIRAYLANPNRSESLLYIGLAREKMGHREEAMEAYREYLGRWPGEELVWRRLEVLEKELIVDGQSAK